MGWAKARIARRAHAGPRRWARFALPTVHYYDEFVAQVEKEVIARPLEKAMKKKKQRRRRRVGKGAERAVPTRNSDGGHASLCPPYITPSSQIQFLEEIVALVVDHDEGGEILHLDAPDRLHAELGIFHRLDLLDAVLGQVGGGPADRGEIESAVLLAGLAHLRRAVALGDRDHRAAGGLELVDEGIHPAGGGRPEGARRIAFRRLGGAGVIDRVVLEIVRQA